ncbi:MAG TPA: peptidase M16 [Rhodospirillaceae bacterium]|nr:peptidase M16 [Rhodospirillaceae bacterium]HAA90812.1 peptidase M16 [Rhodospirillaceae bacterium]HAT34220.1 peptidase M16 [Rhodospirillaceae bacterium]|tara:strand:+ start:483 stop:1832 length:1350 start_codon:yes stop_codon:yes gene_type:complete
MSPRTLFLGLTIISLLGVSGPTQAVEIKTVTSPSGIKAWLVQDRSIPLISMHFIFRDAGAATDPSGKEGRANMVSALLDEGAGKFDSQAFQRQLENQSIQLNFSVGKDSFGGSLKTLNKYRKSAVKLAALALAKPRFDAQAVARIRAQLLTGLKARSSRPGYVAGRVWSRAIYGDHVYSRPATGTQKSVVALKNEDLREYVSNRLTRDRLIVSVVGDISPEDLKPILDEMFGALPAKGKRSTLKKAPIPRKGAVYVIEKAVPQSVVLFGQRGIAREDPEFYTAYVLNHILGGGSFTSRLYNEVREKRGLAYSVFTYLSPRKKAPLLAGRLSTANARVAQSLKVLRAEWQRLAEHGVDALALKNAKSFINGSFALRFSSSDKIANLLATLQYYRLGRSYLKDRKKFINAVSRAKIKKLAKKLLDQSALTVVVVGKPDGVTASGPAPKVEF